MATFSINGIAMSKTQGAVYVPASSLFVLSWSGLEAPSNWKEAFDIRLSSYDKLSCSAGNDSSITFVSSPSYYNDYYGTKMVVGASGSETISCPSGLVGKTLELVYSGTFAGYNSYYVTFYDPVTLTAPTNFAASQSGQTINMSWTASSASGGSGSVIYRLWNLSDGFEVTSTTNTFLSVAASTLGYASCQYRIIAEYGGHSESSNVIWINPQEPSVTAPTNFTAKQDGAKIIMSWGASVGSYGDGGITYKIFCLTDGVVISTTSGTSITLDAQTVGYGSFQYYIIAEYSGKTAQSSTIWVTVHEPSVSTPGTPSVSYSDGVFSLSWDAAVGTYGDGSVTYIIYYGDALNGFNSKSKSVGSATVAAIAAWIEDVECLFLIRAIYSGKFADSGYSSFTIESHRTVSYVDPDTGRYVQCIVYYCADGISFAEQIPSYCADGLSFIECSN